jgi:DNA polymerase elongation subunit (family B)
MQAHSLQLALKIMMNAFFGILSVPYSRYFNVYIAEAITSCGRHTIKSGEKFCNELLNDPTEELLDVFPYRTGRKNHTEDYVAYIDTDSLFVKLGKWIEDQGHGKEWNLIDDDDKIAYIQDIARLMEKYIDNRIFNETQLQDYNSQVHDFKVAFKQEIVAKTALFVKKKKYAYWLLNDEGKPTDQIKVTGLEIVRSESAEAIRPRLTHIMKMIMKQEDDEKIASQIRKYKKELRELDPESLAANIGINNIRKYLGSGSPIKGTPWHVKGVYNYRLLLKKLDLENKYDDVHEGVKAKVIYVKKNPYDIRTITFNEWPKEFDRIIQYDPETMIDKFFIKKVRLLLEPIRKEAILDSDQKAFRAFF